MQELGQEWTVWKSAIRLKELSAAPNSATTMPVNTVALYAKDKTGTSALYLMDDAGSEREVAPPNVVTGTGTANRLAYWTGAQVIAALPALTSTRVPFADASGLLTDSANFTRDATDGFISIKNSASGANVKLDSGNASHNVGVYFAVNASALYRLQIEASTSKLQIFGEGTGASALQFDTSRNTLVGTGSVATNATAPFFQLNSCAGTPTGAPSPATGQVPLVYDTTNNKLYAYNAAWKDITGGAGSGSLTGSGADTQVAYWTGAGALSSSANLIFDRTNVRLGLRVTPLFEFHGQAADGNSFNNTIDCYGTGVTANYRGRAARGTAASFSALQADDTILGISALPGINTNTFAGGARANMLMKAAENLTTSNNGTYITFGTTPTGGSTTLAERFRIGPAGQWGIGGATYGTAGQYFRSGGASAAPTWATIDHGSEITGLGDDDHTIYALLAGRSGGQTLKGGTAASDGLTLTATSGNGVGSETVKIKAGNNGATQLASFSTTSTDPSTRLDCTAEMWVVRDITNTTWNFQAGVLRFRGTHSGTTVAAGAGAVFAFDLEDDANNNVSNVCYLGPFWEDLSGSNTGASFNINVKPPSGDAIETFRLTMNGNCVVGRGASAFLQAVATNATDGFLYIPTCAGTPTGTPTAYTGKLPLVYDTTNNKLYAYNSGWKTTSVFA